jgi:hypothetical protein
MIQAGKAADYSRFLAINNWSVEFFKLLQHIGCTKSKPISSLFQFSFWGV